MGIVDFCLYASRSQLHTGFAAQRVISVLESLKRVLHGFDLRLFCYRPAFFSLGQGSYSIDQLSLTQLCSNRPGQSHTELEW
jgi:hypothetical protein